jgi:hypothetical protein
MLPKARELELDNAGSIESVLDALAGRLGPAAASIAGRLSRADAPAGQQSQNDLLVARLLGECRSKRFDAARDMAARLDDAPARVQSLELIRFSEAADAIGRKNLESALQHANGLRAGVKRALLYAGIAAAQPDGKQALETLKLALKDLEVLPLEHRARLLMPIAKITFEADPQAGYVTVAQAVTTLNEARMTPRKWPFDPRAHRAKYSSFLRGARDASTDASRILHGARGFNEAILTELTRRNFSLHVRGVETPPLPVLLRSLRGADLDRIESIITELRDETALSEALISTLELRLRQ